MNGRIADAPVQVEPAAAHDGWALCAHDLSASYGSVRALDGVELEIPYGVTVAVLGPNGSGKSSLFSAAVGLLRPDRGWIGVGPRGVAFLPQQLDVHAVFPVTIEDVVRMGRWGRGSWLRRMGEEDHRRVAEAIDALDLGGIADRAFASVSGGQRQRALLAQVKAQDAGLILLDEPGSGVDRPTVGAITELVSGWREEGRTVMVATHDLESAARDFDVVLALNQRVVAVGDPSAVLTDEVLADTFRGHVTRLDEDRVVDTSHRHPGAG